MALAERQGSFHRTVIEVVYKTMNQLGLAPMRIPKIRASCTDPPPPPSMC